MASSSERVTCCTGTLSTISEAIKEMNRKDTIFLIEKAWKLS